MRQPLCAAALACLAILASCAHTRVPAYAGEDRTLQSGVPGPFTGPGELPEGTEVVWDFGDGTPPQKGSVDHAFPRAGDFTVTQTVQDKDGEKRTATAHVKVLRRSVPMAIPPDARAALVAQWPWARVSLQREIASRLGLRDFYDQIARSLSEAVGFDVTSAEAAAQNGIDPDEGLGIFTVREDPEALLVAVGISDEAKAEGTVRKLLERDLTSISPSLRPFQLSEVKLPGGGRAVTGTRNGGAEQVAYFVKFGYLYLRTPGATDPLLALKGLDALQPDKGLERDATFLATVKRVGTGDFVFYSAPPQRTAPDASANAAPAAPEAGNKTDATAAPQTGMNQLPPAAERMGPLARTMAQLGASAFAIRAEPERLNVRLYAQLRELTGEKLVQAFSPAKPPPDLAALLPAGAVAYVKLSGSPEALWREIGRAAGARKQELEERIQAIAGLDVEKEWLPSFTGNAGIAFYLDAPALLDAVLGEQVTSFDRSTLVGAVEIAPGKEAAVKAVLEKSAGELQRRLGIGKVQVAGVPVYRIGDGAVLVAQKGGTLYFAVGGPRDGGANVSGDAEAEAGDHSVVHEHGNLGPMGAALEGKGRHLGDVLKRAGIRGFDLPHDQLLYLDVAGAVRQLQRAAESQGGAVGLGARLVADKVAGLRDALLEARPSADGIDAELTVRFRTAGAGGAAGGETKAGQGQGMGQPGQAPAQQGQGGK